MRSVRDTKTWRACLTVIVGAYRVGAASRLPVNESSRVFLSIHIECIRCFLEASKGVGTGLRRAMNLPSFRVLLSAWDELESRE